MDNAVIIGWGTVGKATAQAFGIDKYYSRTQSNITLREVRDCRYIFICLPTPTIDGKCYVDDIRNFIGKIIEIESDTENIFIIRSTVYPGFNRDIQDAFGIKRVVSNPEFLSEDTAYEDASNPNIVVIGADEPKYGLAIKALYVARFKNADIFVTNSVTAELIKYTLNTFFATKVIFANEIFNYAQKTKANYETVKQVLEKHPWGSKNHFTVWYKNNRGVHGKCLPKDLEALAQMTNSPFFKTLLERNEAIINE